MPSAQLSLSDASCTVPVYIPVGTKFSIFLQKVNKDYVGVTVLVQDVFDELRENVNVVLAATLPSEARLALR
eukprot:SAG31_NODE_691_length_12779_cov_19.035095_1_plen_72_part_00